MSKSSSFRHCENIGAGPPVDSTDSEDDEYGFYDEAHPLDTRFHTDDNPTETG